MYKKLFLGISLFSLVFLSACSQTDGNDLSSIVNSGRITSADSMTVNAAPAHDWGNINIMGGDVEQTFTFKNDSDSELAIKGLQTSCMCTTATIHLSDGSKSPEFGMHNNPSWMTSIAPQDTFEVNVVFDPLAHGPEATGPIMRSVFISSSSVPNRTIAELKGSDAITEIKVRADVLSEEDFQAQDEYSIEMGNFLFKEKEFDLGIVKQSQGITTHDFAFKYIGEELIKVTGTPSSCACTEGEISATEFNTNDTGILTVKFDPNLHAEPEGKFFKTVSILTEPSQETQPEVKIWAEMDLDLGPDAYKLKEHNDDHGDKSDYHSTTEYKNMTAQALADDLQDKDFFLLDVHIPEQEHIEGTDAFIDYTKIKENVDQLPSDLNEKIVVYCRSGNMSETASTDLIELGYTNVYNVLGGIKAYNALKNN